MTENYHCAINQKTRKNHESYVDLLCRFANNHMKNRSAGSVMVFGDFHPLPGNTNSRTCNIIQHGYCNVYVVYITNSKTFYHTVMLMSNNIILGYPLIIYT